MPQAYDRLNWTIIKAIRMGILLDPTPADKTLGGAIKPAIKAATNLVTQNYVDAGFKLHEAIKAIRVADEKVEQRAWTFWRESLALALSEFFKTAGLTRKPADREELQRLLDEILAESAAIVQQEQLELTAQDLRKPTDFRLYQNVRRELPDWAQAVAPEHLRDDDYLRRRLDRAFVKGFHRAWFEGGEHFRPIQVYLTGEGSIAIEREDLWLRYYEGLRVAVEDLPLFGQGNSGPSLTDIFVPLRCSWVEQQQKGQGGDRDKEGEGKEVTVRVRRLDSALLEWLEAEDREDPLRIVTGGPGSGKSSSAKMFAVQVARADRCNVLVVPLQGLDVGGDIASIVDAHITDARLGGGCLPENPINWALDEAKPLLLVFDGLDEVARPDGAGLEITRQFLGTLRSWLSRVNSGVNAKFMALVLGRPQAAEESARDIGGLQGRPLMYVEPLCQLGEERLARGTHRNIKIDDPGQLAEMDHRQAFWDGYARFDERYTAGETSILREDGLDDLTIEPLLLYLLMFSGMAGDDWPKAKENRNRVYEAIFRKVHQRDVNKRVAAAGTEGIGEEEFFALMECLGLAAWLGGGRTGDEGDYQHVRDEIYVPEHRRTFESLEGAELRNVAVQFYTHRGSHDQPGYAFIHKSFGEYLTGRALVAASIKWCEDHARQSRWDRFAEDWLRLAGGQHLSPEILSFMIDEARLRLSNRGGDDNARRNTARELVTQLTEVATRTLQVGFPAHCILPPSSGMGRLYGARHWRSREAWQRNAEEALYAAMLAWAEVAYPWHLLRKDKAEGGWQPGVVKVTWPENRATPAVAMLGRLRDPWGGGVVTLKLFARWDFSGQRFGTIDLRRFDLRGVNSRAAVLGDANLNEANLSGADLTNADLNGAALSCVDLSNADLSGAILTAADVIGTNFDLTVGNAATLLPLGMDAPAAWSESGRG